MIAGCLVAGVLAMPEKFIRYRSAISSEAEQ